MKSNKSLIIIFTMALIAAWMYSRRNASVPAVESPDSEKIVNEVIEPTHGANETESAKALGTESAAPRATGTLVKAEKILTRDEVMSVRKIAMSQLMAVYAAQKSFYAEFDRYTTDIQAMGFPFDEGELNAKMGFLREYSPPNRADDLNENPETMNTDALVGKKFTDQEAFRYSDAAARISLDNLSNYCKRGCTADASGFEMLVAIPLGGGRVDVWLINSDKEAELVQDGLDQR